MPSRKKSNLSLNRLQKKKQKRVRAVVGYFSFKRPKIETLTPHKGSNCVSPAKNKYPLIEKTSVTEREAPKFKPEDVLRKSLTLVHPEVDNIAFLYGTILTDGRDEYSEEETANICVFAERQVDRSPCGSGVTARIALQYGRGLIKLGQQRTFVSPTGGKFKPRPVRQTKCGLQDAVIVEVSGRGYYAGSCTFTLEEGDDIGKGFLLK